MNFPHLFKITFILPFLLVLLSACDRVNDTYRLRENEHLNADSYLVAVDIDLEEGSLVEGDLNITTSDVVINNHIQGDVTIVASHIEIQEDALIEGDVIYCLVTNGTFSRDSSATIWGKIKNSCDGSPAEVSIRPPSHYRWLIALGLNTAISLVVGLIAALGTIFLSIRLSAIKTTALQKRGKSFGFGLLTLVIVFGLSTLWAITLDVVIPVILAPIILAIWVITISLAITGFISISQGFGSTMMQYLPIQEHVPVVSTILGASILSFLILIWRVFLPLAFLTSLMVLVVASWSLGAALLTPRQAGDHRRPQLSFFRRQ